MHGSQLSYTAQHLPRHRSSRAGVCVTPIADPCADCDPCAQLPTAASSADPSYEAPMQSHSVRWQTARRFGFQERVGQVASLTGAKAPVGQVASLTRGELPPTRRAVAVMPPAGPRHLRRTHRCGGRARPCQCASAIVSC